MADFKEPAITDLLRQLEEEKDKNRILTERVSQLERDLEQAFSSAAEIVEQNIQLKEDLEKEKTIVSYGSSDYC